MKYVKSLFIALMALLTIVACGGGGGDGDGDESGGGASTAGKNYRQSVTLPATGAEQIVELDGITAEINSITGAEDWLTILKNGEKPNSVKLVAKDNESLESRHCLVTIVDKANNSLALTVTQNRRDAITYKQSVTLPATRAEQIVELEGITAEINSITGAEDWLTVLKNGEKPNSVKLVANDNESLESRHCLVTIVDKANNSLALTVTQNRRDAITYKQSVTLPPTDAVAEVELKDLKYEIKQISGNASWLTVQKAFKDGTAWVTLKATDNEKKEDRSCTVVITGQSNDEVRLSVIQTKKAGPDDDGIDDSHDMQTDQPAYSR